MFFEKEELCFNILDVLEIKQENVNMFNSGRKFDAISFRFEADTYLKTDKEVWYVKDNSVCFVPAGLDYTRLSAHDNMIVINMNVEDFVTNNIEHFTPKNPKALSRLFTDIYNCWSRKEVGYKYKCTALLYEILSECYIQNFKGYSYNIKIKNSIEFIDENYKNPDISVKEAAKKSFISEVYFRKLFKEEFGISPQKYIINLRIQNAVSLMSTGYYSLKEIAYMSGYSDYNYFSVEFKRIKGVSPSEYMRRDGGF